MKTNMKKLSKTSAQTVASFDDLLTKILLRLPMKSLIRFKLVSKHWNSLITNPQFSLVRNPKPNPAIGIFLLHFNWGVNPWYEFIPFPDKSTNPPFRQLNFAGENLNIIVVQSCNGLLLCCSSGGRGHCRRYYVYNPTTNKFSTLPEVDNISSSISTVMHGMCFAFDPTRSPHYKVVRVSGLGLSFWDYRYQIEVYSSETGLWRKWGDLFPARVNFKNGVYWNGAIHWIGEGTSDSLYFNPDDDDHQTPQIMPMPPTPHSRDCRESYYFGESCDHLHYVEFFEEFLEFNVYEMKKDYSEWFVKYHVDLLHVDPAKHFFESCIFEIVRGEKDEDAFMALHIPGKVERYNFVGRTSETIYEIEGAQFDASLRFLSSSDGIQYIESLCCV